MMPLGHQLSQRILENAGNLGYVMRDAYRDETTIPDSRYAEYQFRHYFGTLVSPLAFETAMRGVDAFYTMPLMAHALQLDDKLGIPSIERVPALRQRLIHSMAQADHYPMIGRMFEAIDAPNLPPDLQDKAQALSRHLKKTLFYEHYLTDEALLPKAQERIVKSTLRTHDIARKFVAALETAKNPAPIRQALGSLASDGSLYAKAARDLVKGALETFHFRLNVNCAELDAAPQTRTLQGFLESLVEQGRLKAHHVGEFQQAIAMAQQAVGQPGAAREALERLELEKMTQDPALEKLAPFVRDGFESRKIVRTLQRIQRTAFWPKMAASSLLYFILVGTLLLNYDAQRVQPWQKRLIAEGINPAPVVRAPSYLSGIPGVAVFAALQSDRVARVLGISRLTAFLERRLGYAGRFTVSSAASLLTVIAVGAALIQRNLKKAKALRMWENAHALSNLARPQRNPAFAAFFKASGG